MRNTLDVIKERRSIRKFKPEQIKEEELQAIVESGLYAPSAINKQSWIFRQVYATDRPMVKMKNTTVSTMRQQLS